MPLAKKCDRCGKLYDHYPTGNKLQYNSIRRIQRNAIGNTINSSYAIDLCPECMNEFEKFMPVDIFNKLIDELDASSKNVLKNKNALYGKKDDHLSFRRIKNDEN